MTVDVRFRVEPELKSEAEAVLKAAGHDVSTAIRLFLHCVVEMNCDNDAEMLLSYEAESC